MARPSNDPIQSETNLPNKFKVAKLHKPHQCMSCTSLFALFHCTKKKLNLLHISSICLQFKIVYHLLTMIFENFHGVDFHDS